MLIPSTFRHPLWILAALVAAYVCSLAHAQPAADVLAEARQALQQAAEEEKAFGAAQMSGDAQAARKHWEAFGKLQQSARDAYDRAGCATSDDIDLLMEYARLLSKMEDYDLAEAALARAASLDPENATLWTTLGETQSAQGPKKNGDAIRSLKYAIELEPSGELAARAYASLGALYQEMGLFDFSRENLTKALELKKDHQGAIIALAALDLRNGDVAKASDALDALGAVPELQPFLQRTVERGLADFEASRRWMPDLPENHLAYAKLLTRVGRVSEAIWPLRRCVKLQPDNYVAWNLLGSVYRGMNRSAEAQEAFERSLALNPDQPRTTQVLEELKAELQQQATPTPQASSGDSESPAPTPAPAPSTP